MPSMPDKSFPLKKLAGLSALGLLSSILFLCLVFLLLFFVYFKSLTISTKLSFQEIYQKAALGWQFKGKLQGKKVNLLILGLDSGLEERELSLLTDTIILSSINLQNGRIKAVSFPRDLWLEEFKTKINALFYYGELEKPGSGAKFVQKNISQSINQPIDYFLTINFSSIKDVVNAIGGLDIYVPKGFDDYKFPKSHPEKIINGTDKDFFEHLHFDQGWQKMDGETVLKYVRSRQSEDEQTSGDLSRSSRQQEVIQALIKTFSTKKSFLKNPSLIGQLYQIWKQDFLTNLSDEELIALGLNLMIKKGPFWEIVLLPVTNESSPSSIFYHPPIEICCQNQWVYLARDSTGQELKDFIKKALE